MAALFATLQRHAPGSTAAAHLRLRSDRGRVRDLLLGDRTLILSDLVLLNWRTSPMAEPFFTCEAGDGYELELEDRFIEGVVEERHLLHCERGRLIRVEAVERPVALMPRPQHLRRALSPVEVHLDPVQQAAVDLPADRSLLVLGEAGFGKTTVALRRLLALKARSEGPLKALVLVPGDGLKRLCREALARMDASEVQVETVDFWLSGQARRMFALSHAQDGRDSTLPAIRFKRHRAVAAALPALVRARPGPFAEREDLFHLWGDGEHLDTIVEASEGALARDRAAVLARAKVQFSRTTEEEHAHFERHRLMTGDGRPIDEGTPMQDAGTCDAEDYPVFFAINHLKAGRDVTRWGALETFDHVVVDEAQELAPLELAVIGRAVAPGGSMTIAGDERQQFDPTITFEGWSQTLADAGAAESERVRLVESYRCPPEVVAFARGLFGAAECVEQRGGLLVSRHTDTLHLVARLVRDLTALRAVDPKVRVAIICANASRARRLGGALAEHLHLAVCLDGDFELRPGIVVTCASEVRGLEFDVVVVPELGGDWLDTPALRRALNVAMTRAIHQLWLAVLEPGGPLLSLPDQRLVSSQIAGR